MIDARVMRWVLFAVILDVAEQVSVGILSARYAEMVSQCPEGEGTSLLAPLFDGKSGDDDKASTPHQLLPPQGDLRFEQSKR